MAKLYFFIYSSIKYGRVVVLLAGRQAGKKAVVIKTSDDGTKVRKIN
jgi:ribosomal protein L14E/L6E/L27E